MFRHKILGMVILAGMLLSQAALPARAADCDHAQFVSDLTAPDGAAFAPGATFTKTWRLQNVGSCIWTTSYSLVWVGGDAFGSPLAVRLPVDVLPGQMVDLSVNLAAPAIAGHYRGLFKISNSAGVQFGIGDLAADPFWVDLNVVEVNAVIYDFVANAPYARWRSGAGALPFPGTSGDGRGFAYQVNNPHLEDDSIDTSPGLLTVPQRKFHGYIQAVYPEIQIQQGDRLQTLVNCEFGATSCYVTFRIDYLLPSGAQKTLWSFTEAYDKRFYRASLDLSALAGQRVRFVFMLLSSGLASGDRAIWGSPRIVRTGTTQPPAPPATLTPLPPLTPTATPLGQPPPTIQPSGCDKASFVADVTVPDGTLFSPGAAFTKTWRLKNVGSCAWTTSYRLVYYSGEQMGAPTTVNLPWNTAFNQTVDITINMVAPAAAGKYRGYWILSNASGQYFGIGTGANSPIWAEIHVAGDSPLGSGYDFTANACSAEWRSGAGILPCPGIDGDSRGFVLKLDAPKLEDGSIGAPGLLAFPQNRFNGYIQGYYPTFTVQPGDRFQTTVGCAHGSSCYVTFRLDYMNPNGYIGTFWTWREQYEGKYYAANVDLSPLAGRSVRFILTVLATGSATSDRALWGSPRIARAGGVSPTATPAPSTHTAIPPTNDWLTYINNRYSFQFRYPREGVVAGGGNDNFTRIDLPLTPGTNLREKYLEVIVAENVNPCESPLTTQSIPRTRETVTINGISFLKQTGDDAGAGHLHQWIAYSTLRANACISLDFILHSLNPGNFATPIPVFDYPSESAVLNTMLATFTWLSPPPATATATPPLTSTALVQALNERNYERLRGFMGQLFVFAFWQSQGASYLPDLAVEQLRTNYLGPATVLVADPARDLNALLNGSDPYSIVGLNASTSQALFVSGWGLDGADEAILYITQRPDGVPYWHSVLIAKGGFAPRPDPASHEAFCADTRIPALIEQLRGSMNQSNGEGFAALASPAHGIDVRLWAYQPAVNFSSTSARQAFISSEVFNWGAGPRGEPDFGTFSQVIQPKLQEVLNAPNRETYCDNLTKVYPLATPWPYPGIRFYNLYKPGTPGIELDFRTWLIGFEYLNNQPYVYALVTIVWEP